MRALDHRLDDLREFCDRRGWGFRKWESSQREPGWGLAITIPNEGRTVTITTESLDSTGGQLHAPQRDLRDLAQAHTDAYLIQPPPGFGGL